MTKRAPLATFILHRLEERGESPEHFARRVGVNPSGFGRFLRGETSSLHHTRTLPKIALGLGMRPAELISLAEGETAQQSSPAQAEVLARVPELEEVIAGLPRMLWGTALRFTVDSARSFADGLTLMPRTEDTTRATTANRGRPATSSRGSERKLPKIKSGQFVAA